jgi:hypothetical protein
MKKWPVIAVVAILAVVVIALYPDQAGLFGRRAGEGGGAGDQGGQDAGNRSASSARRARAFENEDPVRGPELAALKKRWLAVQSELKSGNLTKEHQALAAETVDRLLCSNEAIRLIEFLHANNMRTALPLMEEEMAKLFVSPRAAEARKLLIDLPDRKSPDGLGYRETWSYEAGRGCPESEFDAFCAALDDKAAAQNALLGRNLERVATDPEKAISSTVSQLLTKEHSTMIFDGIRQQMAKIPADADFERIEKMLPVEQGEDTKNTSPIHAGRNELLQRWAEVDPAAAANYVLDNSDRIGPERVGVIVGSVTRADWESGLEWTATFPEGPYRDAASAAVIPYIGDFKPQEALQLAETITDPKLREKSIALVKGKQERIKRRSETR